VCVCVCVCTLRTLLWVRVHGCVLLATLARPVNTTGGTHSSADAALCWLTLQKLLIMEIYAPTPQNFTKDETSKACADMA
jgi:hypothetical protein